METPTIQLDPYSEAQIPPGGLRREYYGIAPEVITDWLHDHGAVDQKGNMLCCDGCRAVIGEAEPKEVDGQLIGGTSVEFIGPEGHIVPVMEQLDEMIAGLN